MLPPVCFSVNFIISAIILSFEYRTTISLVLQEKFQNSIDF